MMAYSRPHTDFVPQTNAKPDATVVSNALLVQVQTLFYEKYGLRPSSASWLEPALSSIDVPRVISGSALFTRLEREFLFGDIRNCTPPLHDPAQEQDLLTCVRTSNFLPDGIHDIKATTADGPLTFQIVDVLEIGISKNEQLRRLADRETDATGRRIIRDVPDDDAPTRVVPEGEKLIGKNTVKLLLQDALGRCFWAIEAKPITSVELGMPLGSKITLTNVSISRGTLLLKPTGVVLHGGEIAELNVDYENKLVARLRQEIGLPPVTPIVPAPAAAAQVAPSNPVVDSDDYNDDWAEKLLDDFDMDDLDF